MDLPNEVPVHGFPDYTVSRSGEVSRGGRVRQISVKPTGYCEIILMSGGKRFYRSVHRLVWESFNGPIPEGFHVNHLDGVKTHNALENLECVSASDNYAHAKANLVHRGTDVHTSKLSEECVRTIRAEVAAGVSTKELAERFSVARQTIQRVASRKTWTHIP